MRILNDKDTFEFELDTYRLYLHCTTSFLCVTFWLYWKWHWCLEYKEVKWLFYHKIRASFGFFGVEWINHAKTTYRKDVKSKSYFWEK